MKVITYLGFTVLSIFIQFCVMDFIQEKIDLNENPADGNITFQKKIVDDFLKNITSNPHALFYKKQSRSLKIPLASNQPVSYSDKMYTNSSTTTTTLLDTIDISTIIFDILDVENTSTTESTSTMESFITTTDIDNITEITFETTNKSMPPNTVKRTSFANYCACNLLYQICDVGCCCDLDCTDEHRVQFQCERKENDNRHNEGCIYHLFNSDQSPTGSALNSLFCVVKTNLPQKHEVKQPDLSLISQYNKWRSLTRGKTLYEFNKRLYKIGDPIWLLKNGTIYYLDFATTNVNNYCTDRKTIILFKNEKVQCLVNFNDLEMLHISNTEASMVISATDRIFNSSVLNCSNLHCVNWTILACHNGICRNYNKSSDKLSCTAFNCTNLALKIDYNFYYHDFKIVNAFIKLHIQNFSNIYPFMLQTITVNFIMANYSHDRVIEFSGNPGYLNQLPIIISYAESNFTDDFFNSSSGNNHLLLPENHEGLCVFSNSSLNIINFGVNKRTKCRYVHAKPTSTNSSICESIQDNIFNLLRLNNDVFVSPFGNPSDIKDLDWIKLQNEVKKHEPVYEALSESLYKLHCYNLIDRISFQFVFANVNTKDTLGQNKLLSAKYEVIVMNKSFYTEQITTVLTIDIIFLDATKPGHVVYAGSPNLNINLPKDFFYPFPANNYSIHVSHSCIVTLFCCMLIFIANKITLS